VNKIEKISNDSLRERKNVIIIRPVRILSRSKEKKEKQFYSFFRNVVFATIANCRSLELFIDEIDSRNCVFRIKSCKLSVQY